MVQHERQCGGAVMVRDMETIIRSAIVLFISVVGFATILFGFSQTAVAQVAADPIVICATGSVPVGSGSLDCINPNSGALEPAVSIDGLTPDEWTAEHGNFGGVSCNLTAFDFNQCIWNPILRAIGILLMSLAAWILGISGTLFDYFIQWTVIDFKGTLGEGGVNILTGINSIWATMRDIGNILIIGMFVFIAISTILNIENYGAKKWIVRILLVAILINFSMFFTKFAIETSNFVSRQIYAEIQLESVNDTNGIPGEVTRLGIAESFTNTLGIASLFDLDTENNSNPLNSSDPLAIFLYSIGATIFMLTLAGILLYGVFLLATRAIILVVALLTSSLAFAGILLPGEAGGKIWGQWKTAVINASVFPIIMMLGLYVSYSVISGTQRVLGGTAGNNDSLGAFLKNPTGDISAAATAAQGNFADGQTSILLFIFAAGLLFVSIKVANSFATKIAGFNFAAAAPALGASLMGAGAGIAGRNTLGRFGVWREQAAKKRAEKEYEESKRKTGTGKISDATMRRMNMWGAVGKQSYDPRNIKGVQGALKKTALGTVAGSVPVVGKRLSKQLTQGETRGRSKLVEDATKKETDKIAAKAKIATGVEKTIRKEAHTSAQEALTSEQETRKRLGQEVEETRRTGERATSMEEFDVAARQESRLESQIKSSEVRVKAAQEKTTEAVKELGDEAKISNVAITDIASGPAGGLSPARRAFYGISNEDDALAKAVRKNVKKEKRQKDLKILSEEMKKADEGKDKKEGKNDNDKEVDKNDDKKAA